MLEMFWKVLTVLNYGLPFSFLSGSFALGFLVFLSLKCFRAQILLRWLPLGMDLSSAQSEVRRPSPTLSGLPAPPSTAPSGSAGPSPVSSRSAASAASAPPSGPSGSVGPSAPTMGPGATSSSPPPKSGVSVVSLESLSRYHAKLFTHNPERYRG